MSKDLVSIIMLSQNSFQFVEESVRSVLAQTYTNWELLFVDDNSKDKTIPLLMQLMDEGRSMKEEWALKRRIKVSQTVSDRGESVNRNSALKDARGRWIAFLNVGDVWDPNKLERQIAFMEENGYAFSYTKYGLCGSKMADGKWKTYNRKVVIGGKKHISHKDMLKCCWPAYLTVMYDAKKVGRVQVRNIKENNDYALWLHISDKFDCHLLAENLATMRTPWGRIGRLLRTDKLKWRYEVYCTEEDLKPITSFFYTVRNGWYGIVKWFKYVKKA